MKSVRYAKNAGFTLIETIVALVLTGFLAAMVAPLFSAGVNTASDPINGMSTPLSLQSIMSSIVADYDSSAFYLHDLSQLASNITTGHYGITSAVTVTKDASFKFQLGDLNNSLKVTLTDNATGQAVTYIFTKQQ